MPKKQKYDLTKALTSFVLNTSPALHTIWFLQENPTINFVGLLLGPRGNYLEKLKEETKCNIVIRGKGSLRSGMTGIKKDGSVVDGLEEPLHALITVSVLIVFQKKSQGQKKLVKRN